MYMYMFLDWICEISDSLEELLVQAVDAAKSAGEVTSSSQIQILVC